MIKINKVRIKELKEAEIKEIVEVFNQSFGTNKFSIIRTVQNWTWRYKLNPRLDSEDIVVLATHNGKIIGNVVITFKEVKIAGNRIYQFAFIDDVAVLPEFRREGIGKMMMSEAIEYIKERKVNYSALYADKKSPAHRLYLRYGYKDIRFIQNFILASHPYILFRYLPYLSLFLPLFYIWHQITKMRLKINSRYNTKVELLRKEDEEEFIDVLNRFRSNLTFSSKITKEEFKWKYYLLPEGYETIILCAKKDNKIVGGISLITQEARFYRSKIRIGIINELFYEKEYIGYTLLNKMWHHTSVEKIPVILTAWDASWKESINFFTKIFALKPQKGVLMINTLTEELLSIENKPFYLHEESYYGIP